MAQLQRTYQEVIGPVTGLRLYGDIDETFQANVLAEITTPYLILDLAGIKRITSYGVREWMRALTPLAQNVKTYFVQVSVSMMDQFNMIQRFDCGGELLTFITSYACTICGQETPVVWDMALDRENIDHLEPLPRPCMICGNPARLDDDPTVLFEYARSGQASASVREISTFFRSSTQFLNLPPGMRVRIIKAATPQGTVFHIAGGIDHTFPTKSLVRGAEGIVELDLLNTTMITKEGIQCWRNTMAGLLSEGCQITLVAVPPPILRFLAEYPGISGKVELASISILGQSSSGIRNMRQVSVANLDDTLLATSQQINSAWNVQGDPSFIKDLVVRAIRAVEKVSEPGEHEAELQGLEIFQKPTLTPEPTLVLGEKYDVLCKLAHGGMAEVFLARYSGAAGFKRLTIVKQLLPELTTDSRATRMFLDEARLAARLEHPNIVSILDLGKSANAYFIAMEYVHGKNLHHVAQTIFGRHELLPIWFCLHTIADMCNALSRAHQPDPTGRCLVHGDVTPKNILVSFDGMTKLVDFGVARLAGGHSAFTTESVPGTPAFVAPELIEGAAPSPHSDLWSLGVSLYALLVGKRPFYGTSPASLMQSILHGTPKRPSELRADLSPDLDMLLMKALSKKPESRFESAMMMEQTLRKSLADIGQPSSRAAVSEFLKKLYPEQLALEDGFTNKHAKASFVESLLFAPADEVSQLFEHITQQEGEDSRTMTVQVTSPNEENLLASDQASNKTGNQYEI